MEGGGRVRRVEKEEGGESRQKWHREREGGGQREKQGLSQVVHGAKQVLDKHTESKQSQSTVTVIKVNESANLEIALKLFLLKQNRFLCWFQLTCEMTLTYNPTDTPTENDNIVML